MENVVVKAKREIENRRGSLRKELINKSNELKSLESEIKHDIRNGILKTPKQKQANELKNEINYLQQAIGGFSVDELLKDKLTGNNDGLIDEYHQRAEANKKKVAKLESKAAELKADYLKVMGEVAEIDGHTMKLNELLKDLKPYTNKKVIQLELEHLSSVGKKETPCRITDKEQYKNYYKHYGTAGIKPFRSVANDY